MMKEKIIWGIHAGRKGAAEPLFLKKNFVALGWKDFGELHGPDTDEELKTKFTTHSVSVGAVQLYRFVMEMKVGDIIVLPGKTDQQIHIGEVIGPYEYRPFVDSEFPSQRDVTWYLHIPRSRFSQSVLNEMESSTGLLRIRNNAHEILNALEGKPLDEVRVDKTNGGILSGLEEQSRNFVKKQLSRNMEGVPLEEFVKHLFETMGYRTRLLDLNDPGVNLIVHKDELGFEPPIIKVQVKSSTGKIGDHDVFALYGKVEANEFGLIITLGEFTPYATRFANNKSNLRLINGDELVDLIFSHYQDFDPKYRKIIPLKLVYIPQALDAMQ